MRLTGGDAWDTTDTAAVASILPGGSKAEFFAQWLERLADFMLTMRDDNGKLIPILFRPWHEHTGSWFWWGRVLCTAEQYRQLWRQTVEYLRSRGLTNLTYAYSPNGTTDDTEEQYMERYPGDDVVDLLGMDLYQNASDEGGQGFVRDLDHELRLMTRLGQEHNKPIALTETGFRNTPDAHWWTGTLKPVLDRHPITYVLVWRNAWDSPEENFGPKPGGRDTDDFLRFYEAPNTLFVKDLKH